MLEDRKGKGQCQLLALPLLVFLSKMPISASFCLGCFKKAEENFVIQKLSN